MNPSEGFDPLGMNLIDLRQTGIVTVPSVRRTPGLAVENPTKNRPFVFRPADGYREIVPFSAGSVAVSTFVDVCRDLSEVERFARRRRRDPDRVRNDRFGDRRRR